VPIPDAPKVVYEHYANNKYLWRAYYADQNDDSGNAFTNLHVSQGSHAHFKNCTFKGITYIETDENTDLSDTNSSDRFSLYNSEYKTEDTGGSGFTPNRNIILTPNPDNVLPLGFKKSYIMSPIAGSYRELTN